MTFERRQQITEAIFEEIRALSVGKSADYATGGDTLHNFKHGAIISQLTPFQYLIGLVTKQFGAIATSIAKSPNYPSTSFESLKDKIRDVQVYMILLECLLEDVRPVPETSETTVHALEIDIRPLLQALKERGGKTSESALAVQGQAVDRGTELERVDGTGVRYLDTADDVHRFIDLIDGGEFFRFAGDTADLAFRGSRGRA